MRKFILSAALVMAMVLVPVISFASVGVDYTRQPEMPKDGMAKTAEATLAQSVTKSAATPGAQVVGADGSQNFQLANGTIVKGDWAIVTNAAGNNVWKYYGADGKMLVNTWAWIKGKDGKQRCYYFGADGTCYLSGVTPDGYTVDANGAWFVVDKVQLKQ